MHFSLVIISSAYKAPDSVRPGASFTRLSSGAQPTKANPLDVISVYGRGELLAVADAVPVAEVEVLALDEVVLVDTAVLEVLEVLDLVELDVIDLVELVELVELVAMDIVEVVDLVEEDDDDVVERTVEVDKVVPPDPPLGITTSVTLTQNLFGSNLSFPGG
jgi:hypothetical protein